MRYCRNGFWFAFPALLMFYLPSVASKCGRDAVIFNFGDSNSDTGGFVAASGVEFQYPYGRTFFHKPEDRASDGRLIIDFLCESLETSYLKPYMNPLPLVHDFSNGVNFAISGAATLPREAPFNLGVQINQFSLFHNRSIDLHSKGRANNLLGLNVFENALYMIDIGQNDLSTALNSLPYHQVLEKIPSFISEIKDAMWAIYKRGGKKLWVHNTGPFGCLSQQLGMRKPKSDEVDDYGCITNFNEAAKAFNSKLNHLCQDLRLQMKHATIVYVDVYSIKLALYANSSSYGFEKPLMACCGHGGPPYNYDVELACLLGGYDLCDKESRYISWDGIHYTEAANEIVASALLSTNYSTPPLQFSFFCHVQDATHMCNIPQLI